MENTGLKMSVKRTPISREELSKEKSSWLVNLDLAQITDRHTQEEALKGKPAAVRYLNQDEPAQIASCF